MAKKSILKMSRDICIMCKTDIDDVYRLGEKLSFDNVTVHNFCMLLSGSLSQRGEDDEGISGFLLKDIKKEAQRAHKQRCTFCRKSGANISCCDKRCRRAFHLPCAIQHDCNFEFTGAFQSFCPNHNGIVPLPVDLRHSPSETCAICCEKMGQYNVIESIQSPCCRNNSWFHKLCVQQYAVNAGYFLKCPLCNDTKVFRSEMSRKGIFIPDSDAKWEEAASSPFYRFEQHNAGPGECAAEHCGMPNGRRKCYNEDGEYLLVRCQTCGSKGVHENCIPGKRHFICDDCELHEPPSKRRKIVPDQSVAIKTIDDQIDENNNIPNIRTDNNTPNIRIVDTLNSNSTFTTYKKFKLKEFKIKLHNLTKSDIILMTRNVEERRFNNI